MRKRHIGSLLAAVFCCLLLSAALPGALAETADVDFHWELTVLSWETAESLEATQAITSYEGDVNIAVHEDAPAEGCLYLLVKFSLAKTAAGGEGFRWEQLFAVDEEGVYYARMENDTFIETYGFKRLPATEIRIGSKQASLRLRCRWPRRTSFPLCTPLRRTPSFPLRWLRKNPWRANKERREQPCIHTA